MEREKELNDIPNDLSLNFDQKYDGFLLNSLFKINYQKNLFLDNILIENNSNNLNTDQKFCITKRYCNSNVHYNSTPTNKEQYQKDTKQLVKVSDDKIDDKDITHQYKNFFEEKNLGFQKDTIKKQTLNLQTQFFPYCYVNIDNIKNCHVYDYLYKITGAYLTQNEIILLRKTIFRKILPPIKRDEIRNKVINLKGLDKYSEKIISLLRIPSVQLTIRNYVFERRRNFERNEMIYNFHQIIQNKEL